MCKACDTPPTVYRSDYAPPLYQFPTVTLDFNLNDDITTVKSDVQVTHAHTSSPPPPLTLNGRKDLTLISISINNTILPTTDYTLTPDSLTIPPHLIPPGPFSLQVHTSMRPHDNTLLEGLYNSNGTYCTQCEAFGFRGITFYLDRPDILTVFTVRIEGPLSTCPVLLSNGNQVAAGEVPDRPGRHFAQFHDPVPKPCTIFALVAGQLCMSESAFLTRSGKRVALRVFVQEQFKSMMEWAMECLKRAMEWDEQAFGREYDLEVYNIVAVDDFNYGAMENKGLNVFNTSVIVASPETTTDDLYVRIEGIVGHEYFHNWTGDRVACRDWFQLTLKEGLTVYRDQEFTASLHSRPVKRINDVLKIRGAQFAEDAGAMSHPVRPDHYIKVENFYTCTVYRKGAEVIRMMRTLVGEAGFRKGMDLYFERHDGQAVTCDDFLAAIQDANGVDLEGVGKWYGQAGTPQVTITTAYDAEAQSYTITARQQTPPTNGQPDKIPVLIPLATGLLAGDGREMPLQLAGEEGGGGGRTEIVLRHARAEDTFVFVNVPEKPVLSILRDFSAPVILEIEGQCESDLLHLLTYDTNAFNKWDAGQLLMARQITQLYHTVLATRPTGVPEQDWVPAAVTSAGGVSDRVTQAIKQVLECPTIDNSFASLTISVPSITSLMNCIQHVDPLVLHYTRATVVKQIASALKTELRDAITRSDIPASEPYSPQFHQAQKRELKNTALAYLATLGDEAIISDLKHRYLTATNMTDTMGALRPLVDLDCPERSEVMSHFERNWKDRNSVMNTWLFLTCASDSVGNIDAVRNVVKHPNFSYSNPSCVASVYGGLTSSAVNFHAADGSGYEFIKDFALSVDKVNQIVAGRVGSMFTSWRQLDEVRQGLVKQRLEALLAENLSDNLYEVISKCNNM